VIHPLLPADGRVRPGSRPEADARPPGCDRCRRGHRLKPEPSAIPWSSVRSTSTIVP
jgi:hypothetical protein